MGHYRAAGGVQVGAPVGGAAQVCLNRCGARIGGIHFTAKGFEFFQSDVAGAAFGRSRLDEVALRIELSRGKRFGAFFRQVREQNVRRGMQIALRVAADQLQVLGKRDITLENAGAMRAAAS